MEIDSNNAAMSKTENVTRESAMQALKDGPRGALIIAASAVGLLFAGWLFFYFVLFMSRGHVG